MTDKQFTELLKKVANAGNEYIRLYHLAEEEYERRYGANPSDIDDDSWLDWFALAGGICSDDKTAEDVDNARKGIYD